MHIFIQQECLKLKEKEINWILTIKGLTIYVEVLNVNKVVKNFREVDELKGEV